MKGISRKLFTAGKSSFAGKLFTGSLCLALALCAVLARPAQAVPLGPDAARPVAPADHLILAGGCRDGCQDCNDCPTEIDIVPPDVPVPYDDPIAREIYRSGPPPHDPCENRQVVTRGRRASLNADSCGIRCWYWRLRHGYCGPGCDYYRYRMYGEPNYHRSRYACR